MDLSQSAIHDVVHPTAVLVDSYRRGHRKPHRGGSGGSGSGQGHRDASPTTNPAPRDDVPWGESQLNPKNRIDSLDELPNAGWRIDGCTAFGTQYFALPLFLGRVP